MMKFACALALSAVAVNARQRSEQQSEDSFRMWAEPIRTETGGLADVLRDTSFRMDTSNPSYLFTDLSVMFDSDDNTAKKQLKNKVDQYKKRQLMKQRRAQNSKFGASEHRLGRSYEVEAIYGFDYLYKGSLYIGESNMEMRVIFDTGSDWLSIEGRDCENCLGSRYDPNTSSYYRETDNRVTNKEYGTFIHIKGKEVQDQVCLRSFSQCVDPFTFFLITEQFGLPEDCDGILGLAQGKQPRGFNMPSDFDVGPSLLDVLNQAFHLREYGFSTAFTGRFGDSFVDFGAARPEEMSDPLDYVEVPMNDGFFYNAIPQGVRIGTEERGETFALQGIEAVFTSGIALSMVPSSISEVFFSRLLKGLNAIEDNGVFFANCGASMPDLWFMFNQHWIQVRGKDILMDISEAQDNTLCVVNFIPSVDDFWVFGNTIMKDYYVYHNPERGVMGWVPTVQRFKTPLKKDVTPTTPLAYEYDIDFVITKAASAVAVWTFAIVVAHFVFTSTCGGIGFLNRASRQVDARKQLVHQLNSMNTDDLKTMLATVQAEQSASSNLIQ